MACFICLDENPPPIRMGCACRGSAGNAHVECLTQMAKFQGRYGDAMWTKCQTCKQEFTGPMLVHLAQAWESAVKDGTEADKLAAECAQLAALVKAGHAEDALESLRALHRRCVRKFGSCHPDTCTVGGNLAAALVRMKRFQEAEILQLDVLRVLHRMLGRKHPETMWHENTLGMILSKQGKYDEAGNIQAKLWRAYAAALGQEHKTTLTAASNLATTRAYQTKFAEAAEIQRLVLQAQARLLGPEHPDTLLSAGNLGSSLVLVGACDEAEQLLQSVLASYKKLGRADRMDVVSGTLAMAQEMKARLHPVGTRVRVRGLVSKPEYNGKTARVVALHTCTESIRYRVVLDDGKELLVKPECLERDV